MQERLENYTAFVENKIALTHVIFLWFYFMVSCNHVSIFFARNSYKPPFEQLITGECFKVVRSNTRKKRILGDL